MICHATKETAKKYFTFSRVAWSSNNQTEVMYFLGSALCSVSTSRSASSTLRLVNIAQPRICQVLRLMGIMYVGELSVSEICVHSR
jgi:hypothetical protein